MSGAPARGTIRQRLEALRDELLAVEVELDALAKRAAEAPGNPRSIRAGDLAREASIVGFHGAMLHALTDDTPPEDTLVVIRRPLPERYEDVVQLRRTWDAATERYVFVDVPPRYAFLIDEIERSKESLSSQGKIELRWDEYPMWMFAKPAAGEDPEDSN